MSQIKREWLLHGCLKLNDDAAAERVTTRIQSRLSQAYGGEKFRVRFWPKFGFKNTLWWYEKSFKTPSVAASYFLKTDDGRGPMLYAGISVEKGFEGAKLARKRAAQEREATERWLLDDSWDWHRFTSTWDRAQPLILEAAEALHRELYLGVEFGDATRVSKHYLVRDGHLYWRGGFNTIQWSEVLKFATKPHPKLWGSIFLARAFSLDDCTPFLHERELMDVFEAMRPIRDLWRGIQL